MPPAIAERLGQSAAAANPGAIALAVEQDQNRNQDEAESHAIDHPKSVRFIEERAEEQRPGVDQSVGSPGFAGADQVSEQKLGDDKKEGPLEADQGGVAPDLKLVLLVKTPAFDGLNAKDRHHQCVEDRVPERPGPAEEREKMVTPSAERPVFVAGALLHAVNGVRDRKTKSEEGITPRGPIVFELQAE